MKILMVCLGNICRSPLAEGILKNKLTPRHGSWEIDSAGTSGYHNGELPDPRSIKIAADYQIDICDQRSRQIKEGDLDNFDIIYAMDSSNYQDLMAMCNCDSQRSKISLIMNIVEPESNINVPDPYWGKDGFDLVFKMLDKACDQIIDFYT
jgi:protein-tyrosine phosphatase